MKRLILFTAILLYSINSFASQVPDTGQTACYDDVGNVITCPSPGQPFYGQDTNYFINPMSYTKLDGSGNALPNSASSWSMVRDNVTGLIWETKTNKDNIPNYNDPHDADNTYAWYEPNDPYRGTSGNGTDTKAFIDALNNAKFGGYSDWRLPTIKEIDTIVNLDIPHPGPTINTDYFPNTVSFSYWTSTINVDNMYCAWSVDFYNCFDNVTYKGNFEHVRAVRGDQQVAGFVDNFNGTVTDLSTGLMWQKETPNNTMTWEEALSYCESLTLAGYSDWRLPNRKELRSLVDFSRHIPAINTTYFPDTIPFRYCSSTTSADYTFNVSAVNFYDGSEDSGCTKNYPYNVRAVRAGQISPSPSPTAVGEAPGIIQTRLSAKQVVDLMINSTNIYSDTPMYQWLLLTGTIGGQPIPIYVLSNSGLLDLTQVMSNLSAYTFSFNNCGVTKIGTMSMSNLGFKVGDTFVYGYAYMNGLGTIYIDNIVVIAVN